MVIFHSYVSLPEGKGILNDINPYFIFTDNQLLIHGYPYPSFMDFSININK